MACWKACMWRLEVQQQEKILEQRHQQTLQKQLQIQHRQDTSWDFMQYVWGRIYWSQCHLFVNNRKLCTWFSDMSWYGCCKYRNRKKSTQEIWKGLVPAKVHIEQTTIAGSRKSMEERTRIRLWLLEGTSRHNQKIEIEISVSAVAFKRCFQ